MTLRPVEPARVTIPDPEKWPAPVLADFCAVPGCTEWGHETHHIVRRSETAGPKSLVAVDGLVLTNVCRLCHLHHRWVTGGIGGHRAWIRYVEGESWCWFVQSEDGWINIGPLIIERSLRDGEM